MQELSQKYWNWYQQLNQSLDGYSRYDAIAFYWLSIAIDDIADGLNKTVAKEIYSKKVFDDANALNKLNDERAKLIHHGKNHPGTPRSAFGYKDATQVKYTFEYHFRLFVNE